ncbi:MAG: HAD family hydrolase, partial [Gammaproteobacteria bacterium]
MNIKAITFDLDDTLWPLMPVILKAEKDTNKWLVENYPGIENLLKSEEVKEIRDSLISQENKLNYQLSKLRELTLVEL